MDVLHIRITISQELQTILLMEKPLIPPILHGRLQLVKAPHMLDQVVEVVQIGITNIKSVVELQVMLLVLQVELLLD